MFVISGGVGDFLQSLPFVIQNPQESYVISSHHKRCEEFFDYFGIRPKLVILYHDYDGWVESNRCIDALEVPAVPRVTFFNDTHKFPWKPKVFNNEKPVIGLHLGFSEWSVSNDIVHGYIPKKLHVEIFDIIPKEYNIMVFVTENEYKEFSDKYPENDSFKYVREPNIVHSLARVSQCDAFIGSDSVFKTMSSMLSIPTIVLHGDYDDIQRDRNFIDPYIDAGCMLVYRFKDFKSELPQIEDFIKQNLETY